jgi:hypothetical protein
MQQAAAAPTGSEKGSIFQSKIVNFCPLAIKLILGELWGRTKPGTTYWPCFVCFHQNFDF